MRFEREAKTLASLNHPNIARIYGIEERVLVTELVEREDLSARIARGAIPLAEALPLAEQIAESLEAAHEQGIVHRDLEPATSRCGLASTRSTSGASARGVGAPSVQCFLLCYPVDARRGGLMLATRYRRFTRVQEPVRPSRTIAGARRGRRCAR